MEFKEGLSVVIPCFNEKVTIERAVRDALEGVLHSGMKGEVVVADNGSSDGSQTLASDAGARVVDVPRRGYGAALHGGILAAHYRYVAFGDADLSYPLNEIDRLVRPLHNGAADFVLGTRIGGNIAKGAMPALNRFFGTPMLSFLIRRLYKLPSSDCNSGMRCLRREQYESLALRCPGMEYASEMLVRVSQSGLRYVEVPISFRKDQRGRPPHLKRWRDGWRHLRFLLGNSSSRALTSVPAAFSFVLFTIALAISFQDLWAPEEPMYYHTAFVAISLAAPLLMFSMAITLVRAALHASGQVNSGWVNRLNQWSDTSRPFYISLAFFTLAFVQILLVFLAWRRANWGNISELGAVVRITILTLGGAMLFAVDIGLGIIKLLPFDGATKKSNSQ